ncbi:MAG: bifunctional 5,10-methylenetetrahydrofolate dehydrogenase/5,10-methenyltetrahydrofolate cyclohydrolase [Candidatus Moranbacteria bacterium]|nr:bifunctional 5,10-methylenetetrahydrofolate dehydrogenase/5,10-methenyltetrahydrofolate cyclohydrolase [Candidatus Moranbacteria bacterium]
MKLLYGAPIAEKILASLKEDILHWNEKPCLAVVLVGKDRASEIYVGLKEKKAKEISMNFSLFNFDEKVSEEEILKCIEKLNEDEKVNGIIVQLPLPAGFNTEKIISALKPEKDVDGFHRDNANKFLKSESEIYPVFPHAIVKLLESSGENLEGKKAVVLGNSQEFGCLMQLALKQKGLLTDFISATQLSSNLGKIKQADVVVSAVGLPGLLRGEMLQEGTIVIDGGIEKVGEKVVGDVDFGSTKDKNGYLSPVPGGVGPVTIACLLENTYLSFKAQKREKIQEKASNRLT